MPRLPNPPGANDKQNWRLRLGFNYREGLVLHTVGFTDNGCLRPVAHRLSFAEMVVPYRDVTADHFRRTAFDIGEWGLGVMTTSLELGCAQGCQLRPTGSPLKTEPAVGG